MQIILLYVRIPRKSSHGIKVSQLSIKFKKVLYTASLGRYKSIIKCKLTFDEDIGQAESS
jgi:hypothetical protein